MTAGLTAAMAAEFQRDGFTLGPVVLSDARVDDLRDELDRVISGAEPDAANSPTSTATPGWAGDPPFINNLSRDAERPVWQIVDIFEGSEAFRRLVFEPAIVEAVAALTGATELRLWHDQIQYKPAGDGGVNGWHQDSPLWPTLHPCGTDDDGRPAQITAWVALDDIDETNGCMSMVRRSHRWGNCIETTLNRRTLDLPAPEGAPLEIALRPAPKGAVHFHHGLTWHSSHANASERPRRAIALHYMTERTTRSGEPPFQHPLQRFVDVEAGAKVEGALFPLVWRDGAVLPMPTPAAAGD